MGIAMMFEGMFGIVIDIVLILVVATGNKSAFYNQIPPLLPRST
jgi:Na+-transporting methylmalonyl-CoA/oxaloacetate decarboxylase gamma subunit